MYPYDTVKQIYSYFQDDVSKHIFLRRLEYSLSRNEHAITEMVNSEIQRYGMRDMVYRLMRWLENRTGEVTVFGAGFAGGSLCSILQENQIVVNDIADNRKELWGSKRHNVTIIRPNAIKRGSKVIIGVNSCVTEIFRQLRSLGFEENQIFVPDREWWIGDSHQYFDPEIVRAGSEEVFIDGGSLDGGDSFHFMEWCKGSYKAIYAFEPDRENCRKIDRLAKDCKRVKVFEEGLWSEEKELCFSSGKEENCGISDTGDIMVRVTSLDKRLGDEKVTFIKLDIEGSEMEALWGAEGIIKRDRPKLAVCVYHRPEDILNIPWNIMEWNPDYKLYLRHYSYTDTETVLYAI